MPTIATMPQVGKRIFCRIRRRLGFGHFQHFWRLAVAIACMPGRRTLKRIAAACNHWRTRQAIAHFLNEACWDAPEALRDAVLATLKRFGYQPGDTVYTVVSIKVGTF